LSFVQLPIFGDFKNVVRPSSSIAILQLLDQDFITGPAMPEH